MRARIFRRTRTKLFSFNTGTAGMKKHREFILWVDKSGVKIVHAYTIYHDYSSSHKPRELNYIVTYKE